MPRIIFKCPYIKPGTGGAAAHRSRYVRYVATRDGVEKLTPDKANLPATKKQQAMVERIVRDFPMSRRMFEYEDYRASPTRAAASEFITRAIEDNYDQIAKRENYVSYIAQRPRVERVGSHGLFSGTDDSLVLSKIAEEVAKHPGNVWLPIISLFHDEGHHPHVHMVCYSADGQSGFLTKEGIAQIKSVLAKEIFRQDLTEVYQRQTQRRDELVRKSGKVMKELIQQMRSGTLENPRIEQLTGELAQRLKRTTGKKQYGYLKAPVKAIVDEIMNELAKDPRIAAAYDLWYQLREEVLRTYKNDLPQRLPLSKQKEFKRIKNLVIQEAVRLGEYTEVFAPTDTREPDQAVENAGPKPEVEPQSTDGDEAPHVDRRSPKAKYQAAKRILTDPSSKPEQINQAVDWLTQAAEAGLDYAQYVLGKLYRDGGPVNQDTTQAVVWFSQAAEQGNQYARYFLDHMSDAPSLFASATQLLHHMGRIFQEQAPPPSGGITFVDSKLRQRIREKKIAMASVMSTVLSRLNAFLDSELEQVLCFDSAIDAEEFASRKSTVFLILPEEDPTKNFMAGLMIQTLSRELFSVAGEYGGKLPNRVVLFCDELGTMPVFDILPLFSAGRSRKLTLVPIIQSLAQLEKNYGKEGAEIIQDNCQVTIFGGFAPNSQTAEVLSKALGNRIVLSGYVSTGKEKSQTLQMTGRALMTPDELKSIPKGQFVVMKTGIHPMQSRLRLFLDWGISFGDPYLLPERATRTVAYASKKELEQAISRNQHAQQVESDTPPAPPSSGPWTICAERN